MPDHDGDQVASQDEYDIAIEEGIEDDAVKDDEISSKFSITSYGADYAVDALVKRMRAGAFRIPDFQRRFVWTQTHASKFIEYLLMGLPVPGIFLYKEADTNRHLVIDGQQRLKTLQAFYDGTFHEKKFRLVGVREPWLNKDYNELSTEDQLKLDDSIVHATIFKQDKPEDVLDSIYYVFERINSGGIRLSAQEIRNCIALGPFTSMIKRVNEEGSWRNVFGSKEPNKRAKDEELILRFFAMYCSGSEYYRPMAKFLNDFSYRMNRALPAQIETLRTIFIDAIGLVEKALNGQAFRPVRSLNAAVFDAVMTGLAVRLGHDRNFGAREVESAYKELLRNKNFLSACLSATADEENVRTRRNSAIAEFEKI